MWQKVAEGTWSTLQATVPDMNLPKGTRMRVAMDAPGYDWVFDIAGAELVFNPFLPEGLDMVDVWGEGGKGYVEMEADPVWLVAAITWIAANWLNILIAGLMLLGIVIFIRVSIWTATAPVGVPVALVLVGAAILLAPLIAGQISKTKQALAKG